MYIRKTKPKIYALYKGDKFIDLGTIKELAERQHVSVSSILYYQTPAYKKREKEYGNRKLLIRIEDD